MTIFVHCCYFANGPALIEVSLVQWNLSKATTLGPKKCREVVFTKGYMSVQTKPARFSLNNYGGWQGKTSKEIHTNKHEKIKYKEQ